MLQNPSTLLTGEAGGYASSQIIVRSHTVLAWHGDCCSMRAHVSAVAALQCAKHISAGQTLQQPASTSHWPHCVHSQDWLLQYDVFKARGNATAVPVFIIGIPAAAMFFTGVSSVTANSR